MYGGNDPRWDDTRDRDEDPRDVEVHWLKLGRGPSDDPLDDDPRQRDDDPRDRDRDSRERDHDPRDVFLRDPELPRGLERELVIDRDHRYELNLEDSRTLAAARACWLRSASRTTCWNRSAATCRGRMLEHYSHIRIDAKRQALDALDAARLRVAGGRQWRRR